MTKWLLGDVHSARVDYIEMRLDLLAAGKKPDTSKYLDGDGRHRDWPKPKEPLTKEEEEQQAKASAEAKQRMLDEIEKAEKAKAEMFGASLMPYLPYITFAAALVGAAGLYYLHTQGGILSLPSTRDE